ncbi:MAG: hypothetical protein AAF127_06825 [Pseudomonadota bacterium]
MAVLIPSKQNLDFLKSYLMSDFEMKSSHATEALAALSGFNSQSAFLAAAKRLEGSPAYAADFDSFEKRCLSLGYDQTSSEWLRNLFPSLDLPHPAWRLLKKSDQWAREMWFDDCKDRNVPFIVISKARKWCKLEWDHISADSPYDELLRQALGVNHGRDLFRLFQLSGLDQSPRAFFNGNALVGSVQSLLEADARTLANAFARRLFPGNLERNLLEIA